MTEPIYHIHKRKRKENKLEPFPHPNLLKQTLDKIVYIAGIIGPLSAIPQAYSIFESRNAEGVSGITWITSGIISIIWLFYGCVHKEKPIIITYCLWALINSAIIVGIILY